MGEKKHINKIPSKSRDKPVKKCVYVLFSLCVFFFSLSSVVRLV